MMRCTVELADSIPARARRCRDQAKAVTWSVLLQVLCQGRCVSDTRFEVGWHVLGTSRVRDNVPRCLSLTTISQHPVQESFHAVSLTPL